jgi:hypothetical protein
VQRAVTGSRKNTGSMESDPIDFHYEVEKLYYGA